MDNTIMQQGRFTSDGKDSNIALRSDVDWMLVYNATEGAAAQVAAVAVKHYWQRGFAQGDQWATFKSNAANAADLEQYLADGSGFFLFDSSNQLPGALNAAITAVSAAAIPVVTDIAHGLAAGDVVRLINVTNAQQLGGFDFTVGHNVLAANTFSLDYMPQIIAGTNGSFRKINFNPIYYPSNRSITKITQAAQAVVTLSVKHGYNVGQLIRMVVPAAYGMIEMNGILATIVAIDETLATGNSITLDVNSAAFTAFAFPLSAAVPFTPAEVVPVGGDLPDATENQSEIGLQLIGGAGSPGGANGDVMYWVAGKSFSIDNE